MQEKYIRYFDRLRVPEKKKIRLRNYATDVDMKPMSKEEGERMLRESIGHLSEIQDKLYAHNRYSVLIIFQAMDAAGKDGAVKHVMSGLNPQGVKVTSFKVPTHLELDHDYFWRHNLALPARGEIGIFNRSYYENVLVTRVHPEYILNEKIPGIESVEKIGLPFWRQRFKQIRRYEKSLAENGTLILKFFLHVSKKEQKKRFIERIEDPAKNWKFSLGDVEERQHWDMYQQAYEEAISNTATNHAPWFIIPADDKWFARLAIASIIYQHVEKLNLSYPKITATQKKELEKAKIKLLNEK